MYQEIIKGIDELIKHHKKLKPEDYKMTEQEAHYFIHGLNVAKQQVEQLQEIHTKELAYETFENVVKALCDHLDRYDMEVIIEDVFMDKDNEEEE
jgi:hypothetical protein